MSNGTVKNMGHASGGGGTGGTVENLSLTDGSAKYRMIVRGGLLSIDKALTPLGFAGVESLDSGATGDWMNLLQP